jgi:hypothetical protein
MRIHLFEFEDLSWFPDVLRQGGTDYLRYLLNATDYYKPIIPIINESLKTSNSNTILDLCSGGGGNIEQIYNGLSVERGSDITIYLSDKFPNTNAFNFLKEKTGGKIDFKSVSVDAASVPADIKGFRTMFSAVHHFHPGTVKAILKNAVDNKTGIALFDGGDKNIFTILGIVFFHPIAFFLCTPFFKPFTFSRLFFTYLVPLIPITTIWDGCISILRLYHPEELLKIANQLNAPGYTWKAGKVKNKFGMRVGYLIGQPFSNTK